MNDIAPGWEIVARKDHAAWRHRLACTLARLFPRLASGRPGITLLVRHRATCEIHRVTAPSMEDASRRIAQGHFDHAET
jgi:hypothetical protein